MISVVSSKQARDNFSELLGRVKYRDEVITIEKKGKAFGVLISPDEFTRFKALAKELLVKTSKKIQKQNEAFSQKEVMRDVTAIVDQIRKERYAKTQTN